MKKFLCSLQLLILINLAYAQNEINDHVEFGIDISTPIIWTLGGDRNYSELEFIYRESKLNTDLRFKLSINNYNYIGIELIEGRQIEDNSPTNLKYFENEDGATITKSVNRFDLSLNRIINDIVFDKNITVPNSTKKVPTLI